MDNNVIYYLFIILIALIIFVVVSIYLFKIEPRYVLGTLLILGGLVLIFMGFYLMSHNNDDNNKLLELQEYKKVSEQNQPILKPVKAPSINTPYMDHDPVKYDFDQGLYSLGRERYNVGSQKDLENYMSYLKYQQQNPRVYKYPDNNFYDTQFNQDLLRSNTRREFKINRHNNQNKWNNIFDEALAPINNDLYDFYYQEY